MTRSFDIPVGYIRSFGKVTNIFRVDYNRNRISTNNLYAFTRDIAAEAGTRGVSQNPFDFGVPNLSFTNFGSVQDTNPVLRRDQTISFSDFLVWNHGKHTWRWGGDFRRIQLNSETSNNARGTFTFTGLNTSGGTRRDPRAGSGWILQISFWGCRNSHQSSLERTITISAAIPGICLCKTSGSCAVI